MRVSHLSLHSRCSQAIQTPSKCYARTYFQSISYYFLENTHEGPRPGAWQGLLTRLCRLTRLGWRSARG